MEKEQLNNSLEDYRKSVFMKFNIVMYIYFCIFYLYPYTPSKDFQIQYLFTSTLFMFTLSGYLYNNKYRNSKLIHFFSKFYSFLSKYKILFIDWK
ncbi:hypothetical protein CRU92_03995 [Arcobacter sp. FW59]|nr:hypothetical protein CRU92_03995 [Arcobacter sp. FW59]